MSIQKTLLLGSAVLFAGLLSAQTTQRMPLYETFTSSTCPPCNPGNVHLEGLFSENEGKYVSLKYQMSWPGAGDPYYTAEGGSRRGFYSISSVPSLQLDGGFDANPTSLTQENMDEAYAVPATVEIDAHYQVNEATQTVDVQISITALQEVSNSGGLFLRAAIFEKKTTGNVKTNGETEFEHVMKKMMPSASGTYMSDMDADEVATFEYSYTFNGDYVLPPDADSPTDHSENHSIEEFSDLGVVVWLQRSTTKEVLQSTYAKAGTASITDNETSVNQLSVYPNPSSDVARITYSTAQHIDAATLIVHDFAGKVVFEEQTINQGSNTTVYELDTRDFDSGMYFVTIQTKEGNRTEKLNVVH